MAEATEGLVYRGHPLRRVDNLIYYGSMADKYIVMMQVLDTTPLDGKRKPWRGDGICLHLA